MEREPYRVARQLLERFDPNNPQLRNTQATPQRQQQQRRLTNQTPAPGTEVRQRRQPQTPHPALMHRPVIMATPQPRPQAPPVTMATPAASVTTSQSATSEQQNQPTSSARDPGDGPSSQQFIPPGKSVALSLPPPMLSLPHSVFVFIYCCPLPDSLEWCVVSGMCLGVAPGPPTPCPILPQNRSNMDKVGGQFIHLCVEPMLMGWGKEYSRMLESLYLYYYYYYYKGLIGTSHFCLY